MENIKLAELIKEYDERFSHILGYRRMSWINHLIKQRHEKLGIHSVIRKKEEKI